ncbi:hypothetical protein [Phytohabitans aurantiacus]|uniref:Uncharacterized protein n=1 Tax=Phytohabitans aurantiacus TaxID=3016789 RepID=A0ABQ5QWI1_9ACTN|nr:hypothetical protein [Phytohabitans aurantiacus]GLH98645.1 hypothetical protein Pa4123_39200 [Phytohabitans aurantiacus]
MLAIRMNDAAAAGLGVLTGPGLLVPPDGVAPGLRAIVADGIEVRGEVVVWKGGARWAAPAPGNFPDLTGWECFVNSFHLEDVVPVEVTLSDDGAPAISDADQTILLHHGLAFALEVCRLVSGLDTPIAIRCVVATNRTNGTFRFHRIRAGEDWVLSDLNAYKSEKVVVVDVQPPSD